MVHFQFLNGFSPDGLSKWGRYQMVAFQFLNGFSQNIYVYITKWRDICYFQFLNGFSQVDLDLLASAVHGIFQFLNGFSLFLKFQQGHGFITLLSIP
mgnify:CR=1 FL=1